MLNQISDKIEIKSHTEKNLTTFTIPVGLHPKDVDKILDLLCHELKDGCHQTKSTIDNLNRELEYIHGTLNVK